MNRTLFRPLARTVSVLLHPVFVPTGLVAALLLSNTLFALYAWPVKLYLLWVTALYTAIVPLLSAGLLRSMGKLVSFGMTERRERIRPLLIGILGYALCALTLSKVPSAMVLCKFMAAGAAYHLLCLIISLYWPISLHLTAQGAVTALLLLLNIGGAGHLTGLFMVSILCSGALASARLYLGRHDRHQVSAGFAAGFVTTAFVILYF